MSLEEITEQIEKKMTQATGLQARVKFDFGDDGIIFINSTQTPPAISHENQEADVTLSCAMSVFQGFMNGSQDPNIAFMMGKLKIRGSMGLAMKLNAILED
ncbi:MAG: SCP-2 sterol transfer family protein [Alphaproteobacteria bacterium CG_4_9_14_3_um_filter_47_13]|nr:MAG: SCP-2 sterol transfer family protein [Alphaproteobacteria bacterium CG_4_9_14_3_um_filter_47_13]